MNVKYSVLSEQERLYAYPQGWDLSERTGYMGHLTIDVGSAPNDFFSEWHDDGFGPLMSDEFKIELGNLLDSLREVGGVLSDLSTLAQFCDAIPEARISPAFPEYGIRVNTEEHSYLMKLCPNERDHNLQCYCYRRDVLERHMEAASRGIRFIDLDGKELYRLKDGDQVRIEPKGDYPYVRVVRYLDEDHLQFAEPCRYSNEVIWCGAVSIMEDAKYRAARQKHESVVPLRASLPEICFVYAEEFDDIRVIKRGLGGYWEAWGVPDLGVSKQQTVESLNGAQGISKAQVAAMKAGAQYGWECPEADPDKYDRDGRLKEQPGLTERSGPDPSGDSVTQPELSLTGEEFECLISAAEVESNRHSQISDHARWHRAQTQILERVIGKMTVVKQELLAANKGLEPPKDATVTAAQVADSPVPQREEQGPLMLSHEGSLPQSATSLDLLNARIQDRWEADQAEYAKLTPAELIDQAEFIAAEKVVASELVSVVENTDQANCLLEMPDPLGYVAWLWANNSGMEPHEMGAILQGAMLDAAEREDDLEL